MTEQPKNLPDPVLNRRATAGRLLRFIYGSIVIGLGLFLGWQIIKPWIYTQSAGSVVAPYHVISTPFTARIVELSVNAGDSVKKGQVVATVRSPEIDALRANLLRSVADQVNKLADLQIRLLVATNSVTSARMRVTAAQDSLTAVDQNPGQVSSIFRGQLLRELAQAKAALAQIEAEISETGRQLQAVQTAKEDIEKVKQFVENAFNNGKQLAPIEGVVANHTAKPGQSVTAGTSIVEIYDPNELHVQWILAADRLIQPQIGAPVYVLDGNHVMRGVIKEVYSISEQTQEGVTVFSRRRSGQLVRIALGPDEKYPAYMTDVEVRYNYWPFMSAAVELYVDMMTSLGLWRE